MSILGAAAEDYARSGVPVFPVRHDGSKAPLTQTGFHAATTDLQRIAKWWARWPEAWIGLPCGLPLADGRGVLDVIDVDPRHGGAIDPAWPETRMAETLSGGNHLYYVNTGDVLPPRVAGLGPGLDLRTAGSYVIVPPTPGYRWINNAPFAAMPQSIRDTVATESARRSAEALARGDGPGFELSDEFVAEGQRNDYIARAAGWFIRTLDADDITELDSLCQDENERVCRPPLDPVEVRTVAKSILNRHYVNEAAS
jgi:hypothetical protein